MTERNSTPVFPDIKQHIDGLDPAQLRKYAGRIIVFGVLMLIFGFLALCFWVFSTITSVIFIGSLMIAGGVAQIVQSWKMRGFAETLLFALLGVIYIIAGVFCWLKPLESAIVITLLLGISLIVHGALRLYLWFKHHKEKGWNVIAFSGVFTLLTGVFIVAGWPISSVYVLGVFLGIDLTFQGAGMIALGSALKKMPEGQKIIEGKAREVQSTANHADADKNI